MTPLERDLRPGERWTFDGDVTAGFDEMLDRSIPQHRVMRDAVAAVASYFIRPGRGDLVVDLGCSRGEAIARLVDRFGAGARFVGLEISEPMLAAARTRFDGYIKTRVVDVRKHDLRAGLPVDCVGAAVALSVLTLMFVPIERRWYLLQDVFEALRPGGALVLVEKLLGETPQIDELLVAEYYRMKTEQGYSQEEIERKRLALEGVLVPVTAGANASALRGAGFRKVECFWRWMNFGAFVAVKP